MKSIIESNRHITVREIEEMLNIPKSTIDYHIQRLGPVKKLDIRIPHKLNEIHLTKQHRKLNRIKKRLCCLLGGIGKVWYFLSCFQETKQLIRMSTVVS